MDSLPVNITDIAVLAILLVSGVLALMRGFIAEVLSVAAWVGAFLLALYNHPLLVPYFTDLTGDDTLAAAAAGTILFVGLVILFSILARVVGGPLATYGLGAVDRSLGFLFGLVRGAFIVSFAYLLILLVDPDENLNEPWIRDAKSLPLVKQGAYLLRDLAPPDIFDEADLAAERLKREAEEQARKELRDRMLSPTPKADAPAGSNGYTDKERQEMNRAVQGTQ